MTRPPNDWGNGQGEPVPRWRRSSRRAYDAQGREIEPATIANARENGPAGLLVECEACGRSAALPFAALPDGVYVPDVAVRLRCSGCGARGEKVRTWPDWTGARARV